MQSFLQFSVSAFFGPARTSLIASYVEPEKILAASTLDALVRREKGERKETGDLKVFFQTWSTLLFIGAAAGGFFTHLYGMS